MTCLPIPGTAEYDELYREMFKRIPAPVNPRQGLPGFPISDDEEVRL